MYSSFCFIIHQSSYNQVTLYFKFLFIYIFSKYNHLILICKRFKGYGYKKSIEIIFYFYTFDSKFVIYPFKFFKADGLFFNNVPTVEHLSKFEHSPQVVTPFFNAHLRIPHILSQNTVLIPSTRQPWQLMCSGRIGALFFTIIICFLFYFFH